MKENWASGKSDWLAICFLLVCTLAILIPKAYALDLSSGADASREYQYALNPAHAPFEDEVFSASVYTVWMVRGISSSTRLPLDWVYRYWPLVIVAWLPVLAYLIGRRFVAWPLALIGALFFMFQPSFLTTPDGYRTTIGVTFLAAFLAVTVSLLSYRWKISLGLLSLASLAVSHYGTSFLTIYLLASTIGLYAIGKSVRFPRVSRMPVMCLSVVFLSVASFGWYGFVGNSPVRNALYTIVVSISEVTGIGEVQAAIPPPPKDGVTEDIVMLPGKGNLFALESRDRVVQSAFGKTWWQMNAGQRIEFVASWTMIGLMTLGLAYWLFTRRIPALMGLAFYLALVVGVAIPSVSVNYGISRIYMATTPLLAMFIPIGGSRVCKRWPWLVSGMVLAAYALSTTGTIHGLLGITR